MSELMAGNEPLSLFRRLQCALDESNWRLMSSSSVATPVNTLKACLANFCYCDRARKGVDGSAGGVSTSDSKRTTDAPSRSVAARTSRSTRL